MQAASFCHCLVRFVGDMLRRVITEAAVEEALLSLFIAAEGTQLRREDRKKAVEVAALLRELTRHSKKALLVDAAAGKAYVGLLAAALLGFRRVCIIERESKRVEACRVAASRMGTNITLDLVEGDVEDPASFPSSADVIVGLHACGSASDAIIDATIRTNAKWLYLVPCCYAETVPFAASATTLAEKLGISKQAEIRRRFVMAIVDAERVSRLECAGYEVTTSAFVPPTITPHNMLLTARRVGEPSRMERAKERRARLLSA